MPSDRIASGRERVVIVGGGFGGLAAARALRHADAEVTLVDRTNHHLFQPLLYQVATGGLSVGQCASPIRSALAHQPNATVLMADVRDVDVERRQLLLDRGERLGYDRLIVACGAQTSYFGHDDWAGVTCGLKTLDDAVRLRDRIFGAFEEAERADDPAERDAWLTFVIIGGGPTGVEIAGQLAIIAHHALRRDFTRIDPRAARVVLLDAGDRVVSAFAPSLSRTAARELGSLGVDVREGIRATAIDDGGVTIEHAGGSERIAARTVVWAAGVRAADLAGVVARAAGAQTDRAGRVVVRPDLTLEGHPEIAVVGDAALLPGPDGRPLPGLATVAIQQARHVARGERGPFRYFDKGALAVVGRGRAICEIRGLRLSGPPAFATYLGVHLYYLSGVHGRRVQVLGAWASAAAGALQNRVIGGPIDAAARPAPPREPAST